jgi:hypothetical protein
LLFGQEKDKKSLAKRKSKKKLPFTSVIVGGVVCVAMGQVASGALVMVRASSACPAAAAAVAASGPAVGGTAGSGGTAAVHSGIAACCAAQAIRS